MSIPIRNIFFLLAYAWDLAKEAGESLASAEEVDVPEDLFALVLASGIQRLVARGLDRGYLGHHEPLAGLRGRIDLASSLKTASTLRGTLWCSYDDLSFDVIHNRIIRTTIARLLNSSALSSRNREALRRVSGYFSAIAHERLRQATFQRVQLHSNNRPYRLILSVCELLHRKMLPDPTGSGYQFASFASDELNRVFEAFLRNFYAREQDQYSRVSRAHIQWQRTAGSDSALRLLPRMETDITLVSATRSLIIEAKYYDEPFVTRPDSDGVRLRSQHLYQLYAYLQNTAFRDARPADGMLLYASPGGEVTEDVGIQNHKVRIATVDLSAPLPRLRSRLLGLIEW